MKEWLSYDGGSGSVYLIVDSSHKEKLNTQWKVTIIQNDTPWDEIPIEIIKNKQYDELRREGVRDKNTSWIIRWLKISEQLRDAFKNTSQDRDWKRSYSVRTWSLSLEIIEKIRS